MKSLSPIFIHSLFRSGSTYLFHVFRRSDHGYWCYQEALHEIAFFSKDEPSNLLSQGTEKMVELRHPQLSNTYFYELFETWSEWKDIITESSIYDAYFGEQDEDIGIAYWLALAKAARGRPVFQECRTAGRIGAIKSTIGGYHIYLWRNPWDQWWSYKVAPYFDVANQIIIHSSYVPPPVQCLLGTLNLPAYNRKDLFGAFSFYSKNPLSSEHSYLIFYLLWCLGMQEGLKHADLMLSIDRLSDSEDYRAVIIDSLKEAGIDGIDFSDCQIPRAYYGEKEKAWFQLLEEKVHECLIEGGWSSEDIEQIQSVRHQYMPNLWSMKISDGLETQMLEQAIRARELAKSYETTLHGASKRALAAEGRAESAESLARSLESAVNTKLLEMTSALHAAEARMERAEQAAVLSRVRAERAEEEARVSLERALSAEGRAASAESLACSLESAVNTKLLEMTSALHAAEARAERAEEEAVLSRERAELAEKEASVASERALAAEGRAESAESLARSLESAVNTKLLEMTSRLQFLENKLADTTKSTIENQDQYEAKLAESHAQINALYNSISWRITKPLRTPSVRFLYRQVVRIREQGLMGRIKFVGGNLANMAASRCIHHIEAHPGLYDTALKWIHRLGLYGRARAFYRKMKHGEGVRAIPSYSSMNAAQISNIPVEITHLSPRARRIYFQLKEAIERRNKGL